MSTISNNNYYYSVSTIRQVLDMSINNLIENKDFHVRQIGKDFTRNRKVGCKTLIELMLRLSSKTIQSDLMDFFDSVEDMPTASAVCQQRAKLSYTAFQRIFHQFTTYFNNYKTYNGYFLLACDGSDINIAYNPKDSSTHHRNNSAKGFNQLHLNALFDVLNCVYMDVNIDTATKTRECGALKDMINDHNYPANSIIICDRGYEKYNLIAVCIEKNQKFIIRVKDINSNGILSGYGLPDEAFDTVITKKVTRLQTKETKSEKEYSILMNGTPFDYLPIDQDYYEMKFRVVRFKITDDTYECLITNLTEEEMKFEEFKDIYHLRWGIENAFRDLKYTIGMHYFHSANQELIKQEIYCSLIVYNFSQLVINNTPPEQESTWKYKYRSNFKTAVTNVRLYLRERIDEDELAKRIKKFLIPIRPGRTYGRNVKPQSSKTSSYYAA